MSKSNDSSTLAHGAIGRELSEAELEHVSGGDGTTKGNLYVGETVSGRRIQKMEPRTFSDG